MIHDLTPPVKSIADLSDQALGELVGFLNPFFALRDNVPTGIPVANIATPGGTTTFLRADGTWARTSPTPATTLPASPVDGQQALLVDSVTAPTWAWLFQYSATVNGAGGRPWLFIGGSPGRISATTSENVSSGSGVYGAFPTNPGFVLPRDGTYGFRFGGTSGGAGAATSGSLGVSYNGVNLVDPNFVARAGSSAGAAVASETIYVTNLAAALTITILGEDDNSANRFPWSNRWCEVFPQAVS